MTKHSVNRHNSEQSLSSTWALARISKPGYPENIEKAKDIYLRIVRSKSPIGQLEDQIVSSDSGVSPYVWH